MILLLTFSSWLYGKLLSLYPTELRREFGAEMHQVFTDDLTDAWRRRRTAGIARVWWWSLQEFLFVAPAAHWANPYVAVPLTTFAFSAIWNFAIFGLALHRALPAGVTPQQAAVATVLMPSSITAAIALVVVGLSRRGMMTSLDLLRSENAWRRARS